MACINLGLLNDSLKLFWIGAIWFSVVVWYYYADYVSILVLVVIFSVGCWSYREYQLATQQNELGEHTWCVSMHKDDMNWTEGYLTAIGYINNHPIKIQGRCDAPPENDKVRLCGRFLCTNIETNRNRFNFNAQAYWRTKGVVLKGELIRVNHWEVDEQVSVIDMIKSLHNNCVDWFENLPAGLRDYGETLLLGYTRADFYTDNVGIQKLGLVHLFSISGFQITLCYRVWFALSRCARMYREDAQIVWFALLVFIWFFAGGVQSLIRAILVSGIMNYLELRHINMNIIDVWGITLIGSLLCEPAVLHQLGGQLSFLLSFGLLWLQRASFWHTNLMLNILISPCLIAQTYSWQPIGILANLVIIPLFAWAVIPTVVIGICAHLLHANEILQLCNTLITYIQDWIALGGRLPGEIVSGAPSI